MTDLKGALTEAQHNPKMCVIGAHDVSAHEDDTDAILAHPAMQAIAEKVALADAVESLPDAQALTRWGDFWYLDSECTDQHGPAFDSPLAAIEEATR